MLTGPTIAQALATDREITEGGMSPSQLKTLQAYVVERLPMVVDSLLGLPATYANCCLTTATCLTDMVSQGTIIKIMMDAPCCGCGVTPEFCESVNREYEGYAKRFRLLGTDQEPIDQESELTGFGLDPALVDKAAKRKLTIADILEQQPFLFLHPHIR